MSPFMRLHAVLVSIAACVGSAILAALTLRALTAVSTHVAAFYLTSLSWASLSLFSCLGFVSAIRQHPLILTIFARFVLYHLPASFLCNLFLTAVLFRSYRDADTVLRSPQCALPHTALCDAATALQTMAWLYLFTLLPASIAQSYVYVVFQRFIGAASRAWALEQELAIPACTTPSHPPPTAAELWFTMEPQHKDADDSFLPVISPVNFAFPLRTPASAPSLLPHAFFPRLGQKGSRSTLFPELRKEKGTSGASVVLAGPDNRSAERRSQPNGDGLL